MLRSAVAAVVFLCVGGAIVAWAQSIPAFRCGNVLPYCETAALTPKLLNALSSSAVGVKGAPGVLGMLQCYNPNSTQQYIQIFNVVSGSVSVGTTTPLLSIAIAPSSTGGFALSPAGVWFSTAIAVAATTTATGSGTPSTAVDCNAGYQ